MNEKLPFLRKKSMSLPLTPGVYLMKDKTGKIIYVGKAKALKNRVSQYFGSQNNHTVKVRKMVEHVDDFDYILTDSEFEALVLECSLIKQHSPKYNILLKDDKGFSYIKITPGPWKNIFSVKQKANDSAEYLGPYTGSYSMRAAVDEAKKIFRLPQCSKQFPRDCGKSRPCLNYFINQCSAPCAGKISEAAHNEAVEQAIEFLVRGSDSTVEILTKKMLAASENLEFEKAAKLRDRINAINKAKEKQKVVCSSVKEQDIFSIVGASDGSDNPKACLAVLRFSGGRLFDSESFLIDLPEDLPSARHELLHSYYTMRSDVPPKVAVDGEVAETELTEQWLSSLAGRKVVISQPQRGEQKQLLEMCRSNAAQKLALSIGKAGHSTAALDELAGLLGMKVPPDYIEAYDISHTAGSDNVAGMVVFRSGVPYKKAYKRFSVKSFEGQDDYASMAEVIERRMNRYLEEKGADDGFGRLPDLILLDGGIGQVHAVAAVLVRMGIDVPLFGMVKDSHHRTRAIAWNGGEISLTSKRAAFTLVSSIQEEVHRFAVAYHHAKHSSAALSSSLLSIEGIGKTRAAALMRRFRTIKAISAASVEELAAVEGMSLPAAKAVKKALGREEDE